MKVIDIVCLYFKLVTVGLVIDRVFGVVVLGDIYWEECVLG